MSIFFELNHETCGSNNILIVPKVCLVSSFEINDEATLIQLRKWCTCFPSNHPVERLGEHQTFEVSIVDTTNPIIIEFD